ncbi:MAG: hypothetical protein BroJett039_11730 [Chloroflexota bacterium]|nr:MAG: hypothetical protein BroJett039_11730 [Chloroflexota bacterium]
MKRFFLFSALLVVALLGLSVACAAPAPTAAPTAALPTAPPAPPTATVAPTTAASSDNAAPGALAQGIVNARDATIYRVNLTISGKGAFMAAGGATPDAAADEAVTLMTMQGEVNQQNTHFVIQGLLTSLLGIDPTKPFEVIRVDDVTYVKGPAPLIGATEERWYQAPPEAASLAQPPMSPASFLNSFGDTGLDPADFKLTGSEALDGKACQVYAGDKAAVVNAFNRFGGAAGATQEDLDSIESAEFKFWVCEDGYVHRVKMLIEGHDQTNPTQKSAFDLSLQLTDFDGDFTITPPADAIPLLLPSAETPEPDVTPTP